MKKIAIACRKLEYVNLENKKIKRIFIYPKFIEMANRENILLIPVYTHDKKILEEIVKITDGLIIPGRSNHTNKKLYNLDIFKNIDNIEKIIDSEEDFEDKLDLSLIDIFRKNDKKILGVCGGHQIINVYMNGTLIENINNHKAEINQKTIRHDISISKDSILYDIYNKEEINVNSIHTQAIEKLGVDLKVIARSKNDNIIEAIESLDKKMLGIQWHPELDNDDNLFKKFFEN